MNVNRRRFALSLTGIAGGLLTGSGTAAAPQASTATTPGRAQPRLPPAIVTRIRVFYPPNYARTATCAMVYDRGGSLNVIRLPAAGGSSR